uniref:amyloid beta A4 precursor protein-binding family B member 1-interacting protein-like n=1 Tax=Myxine glutinosa TaxID=7769 RepID=UPI00358E5637
MAAEGDTEIDKMFGDFIGELDQLSMSIGYGSASTAVEPSIMSWPAFNIDAIMQDEVGLDDLMADLSSIEKQLTEMSCDLPCDETKHLEEFSPPIPNAITGRGMNASPHPASKSSADQSSEGSVPTEPIADSPPPEDENLTQEEKATKMKAEKIRIALQKMKEAQIRKLVIRVGLTDESFKNLMVEEQQSVRDVLDSLHEKTHTEIGPDWCLLEINPALCLERFYEDHENLIENLVTWTRDSENLLTFVERREKYSLFRMPENYLLGRKESKEIRDSDKETFLEECFCGSSVFIPELEGELYLKEEGKKTWRKRYFCLRASGIYTLTKSKASRDFICFIQFENVNVYYGIDAKSKLRAPTDHCFALKHPQIQKKSDYIKLLCCDDAKCLQQWVMGIRIAKYGRKLYDNYKDVSRKAAATWVSLMNSSTKQAGHERKQSEMAGKPAHALTNTVGDVFSEAWKRGNELSQVKKDTPQHQPVYSVSAPSSSQQASPKLPIPELSIHAQDNKPFRNQDPVRSPVSTVQSPGKDPSGTLAGKGGTATMLATKLKAPPSLPRRASSLVSNEDQEILQKIVPEKLYLPPPPPDFFPPPPPLDLSDLPPYEDVEIPPPPNENDIHIPPPPPCFLPPPPPPDELLSTYPSNNFIPPNPPPGFTPQPPPTTIASQIAPPYSKTNCSITPPPPPPPPPCPPPPPPSLPAPLPPQNAKPTLVLTPSKALIPSTPLTASPIKSVVLVPPPPHPALNLAIPSPPPPPPLPPPLAPGVNTQSRPNFVKPKPTEKPNRPAQAPPKPAPSGQVGFLGDLAQTLQKRAKETREQNGSVQSSPGTTPPATLPKPNIQRKPPTPPKRDLRN